MNLKKFVLSLSGAVVMLGSLCISAAEKGGVYVNSDAWQFWYKPADRMIADEVKADIDDFVSGGGVKAIFFNMNFQRTMFPTEVGTPVWKDVTYDEKGETLLRGKPIAGVQSRRDYKPIVDNTQLLWKNVPDFMALRYKYCHEKGVEMWHSMRMNDVHWAMQWYEHRPQHSDLWLDHGPELTRAWYRHNRAWNWRDHTFDYGQKKIRDYHLGLAREYLLNWESDGIELDWLRHTPHSRPGYDELNTPLFTEFMRDVRKAADEAEKKWGHKVGIAVRVPWSVEEALALGFDVQKWAQEGLVNIVIPSGGNCETPMQIQVGIWKRLLPSEIIVAPCIINQLNGVNGSILSMNLETDNGFASSFYQMGADSIYFYNHFPRAAGVKAGTWMRQAFANAADPKKAAAAARRHVVTQAVYDGEGMYAAAPLIQWEIMPEYSKSIRIHAGQGVAGRKCRLSAGFSKAPEKLDLYLNTIKLTLLPSDTPKPSPLPKGAKNWIFLQADLPEGVLHDGWNVVEFWNLSEHPFHTSGIAWVEISVAAEEK